MSKTVKKQMSQEMIENIKNYGDEILTLKDFITSVRKRPGMYIGGIGDPGFINMIREIIQNSLDELNKESSPCDTISITYDERSFTVIVEDNGRGIPFNNIIRVFENEHTSSNFEKKPGEYSSGLHGVGAKVTNALSKKFIVESFILGEGRRVEFDDGYPWKKGEMIIKKPDVQQGTRITFKPELKVMGDLGVSCKDVVNLINLILPLNKLMAKINFTGVKADGKIIKETFVNEDGILGYLIDDTNKPLIKPVNLFKDTGIMKADIIFTYDVSENPKSIVHSFSNFCPTQSGTHVDGFFDGITYFLTNYMNKKYLATVNTNKSKSKSKTTVTSADVKDGLCVVINAAHLEPIFSGQAKERLSNQEMRPFVKNMTIDLLDQWSKENPQEFLKVCKYLKTVADLRAKADKEKVKISRSYSSSALTGLPSNFVAPNGKKNLELWICEGDSALGAMRNYRDRPTQGLFPVKGKIPNAFKWSRSKFLANDEISGMISIIFDKYPNFDINKLGTKNFKIDVSNIKWSKIVLGTDADPDGKHIDSLFMRFFLVYMPELIEAGMVYEAKPPLYGVAKGKNMVYLNDRIDYVEYIQKTFSKKYTVFNSKGKKFTQSELSKILYDNIDYVYEVNKVSGRYHIDPSLLESILLLRKESKASMKRKLKKLYRFLEFEDVGDTIIIKGAVGDYIQTVFYNNKLLKECTSIIKILDKNKYVDFIINDKPAGLYGLMYLFDTDVPNIERYKGLGEMGDRIFDAAMDPKNRTLVQYTIKNVKETLEKIRYYENNIYELISNVEVTRFDMLD